MIDDEDEEKHIFWCDLTDSQTSAARMTLVTVEFSHEFDSKEW
jgi:hypothetical protein